MLTSPAPGVCAPICVNPMVSDPDGDGFGFENNLVCVVSTSLAALQNTRCDAPNPPPPPPPPPPPSGTGWRADYTATMFGHDDCAPLGVTDGTNLNQSTCVARGAVRLSGLNTTYFGAAGDLSSLCRPIFNLNLRGRRFLVIAAVAAANETVRPSLPRRLPPSLPRSWPRA